MSVKTDLDVLDATNMTRSNLSYTSRFGCMLYQSGENAVLVEGEATAAR